MARAEYKFYAIKLNTDKDADMINFLDIKKNKQAYLKKLIIKDMILDVGTRSEEHKQLFKEWEERMSK